MKGAKINLHSNNKQWMFEKHNCIYNSLKNTIEVISCFFFNTLISEKLVKINWCHQNLKLVKNWQVFDVFLFINPFGNQRVFQIKHLRWGVLQKSSSQMFGWVLNTHLEMHFRNLLKFAAISPFSAR